MEIPGAFAADMNIVAAPVVLKGNVQGLMYIANPVAKEFQGD
jgi:hypothetical protein